MTSELSKKYTLVNSNHFMILMPELCSISTSVYFYTEFFKSGVHFRMNIGSTF